MKKLRYISITLYLLCYICPVRTLREPRISQQSLPMSSSKRSINIDDSCAMFRAGFEYPEDFDLASLAKIYYKGDNIPIENGTFMFREDANANIFNILFTEAACPEFLHSITPTARLSHIKTKEGCKSRYFHLSRSLENNYTTWHVTEININKKSFKIPLDRTIIILMNPAHLGESTSDIFKNKNISKQSKTVVSLPTIVLHHLLDRHMEYDGSLIPQLSTIDMNTIHPCEKKEICEQRGSTIIIYNKRFQ